ncbi:hypothetical protein PG995_006241 [Apiospora arundinis]
MRVAPPTPRPTARASAGGGGGRRSPETNFATGQLRAGGAVHLTHKAYGQMPEEQKAQSAFVPITPTILSNRQNIG